MARVYNFSAGPAVLPIEVLKEAQEEMLDYRGCGMSVMEMSHRGKVFDGIIKEAEKDLREIMNIPDNYKVLFLQGGAHQQFSAVPMNMTRNGKAAQSLLPRTRLSVTFPIVPIFPSPRMRITYTSARTIRSTGPSSGNSPIPRVMNWSPTYRPVFCLSPST